MRRICILLVAICTLPVQAGQMIVLGDSLSDGGYFFGTRFTDPGGNLWHEYLADKLGLSRATTTSLGFSGLNLAIGGSVVEDLQNQVNRYAGRYTWQSGDLCALWIGGNDVRSSPGQNMSLLTDEIGSIIGQLAAQGVDRFIVPNLPDIGAIPEYAGDPAAAALRTSGTVAFNTALETELATLESTLSITIYRLDVFGLFDQMLFYSADYGYSNTSEPLNAATGSPDPSTYAFWDEIHPTTRSHDLINLAARAVIDAFAPIELVSQSIEPDLSLRQTWVANPELTYQVLSGTELNNLTEAASYTESPAHTVVVPAPGPSQGFYQTRVAP